MYTALKQELEKYGIKLTLTEDGLELVSLILEQGCPVKVKSHSIEQIDCPLEITGGIASCRACWKSRLKKFVVKE